MGSPPSVLHAPPVEPGGSRQSPSWLPIFCLFASLACLSLVLVLRMRGLRLSNLMPCPRVASGIGLARTRSTTSTYVLVVMVEQAHASVTLVARERSSGQRCLSLLSPRPRTFVYVAALGWLKLSVLGVAEPRGSLGHWGGSALFMWLTAWRLAAWDFARPAASPRSRFTVHFCSR